MHEASPLGPLSMSTKHYITLRVLYIYANTKYKPSAVIPPTRFLCGFEALEHLLQIKFMSIRIRECLSDQRVTKSERCGRKLRPVITDIIL